MVQRTIGADATGYSANSSDDFFHTEWLHNKVVGAQFQPKHFVDFFGFGTDENDGYRVVNRTYTSAKVIPIHTGHHNV